MTCSSRRLAHLRAPVMTDILMSPGEAHKYHPGREDVYKMYRKCSDFSGLSQSGTMILVVVEKSRNKNFKCSYPRTEMREVSPFSKIVTISEWPKPRLKTLLRGRAYVAMFNELSSTSCWEARLRSARRVPHGTASRKSRGRPSPDKSSQKMGCQKCYVLLFPEISDLRRKF